MAGPITLKLLGITRGNSVSVLVRVRGRMIQDSLFIIHCFLLIEDLSLHSEKLLAGGSSQVFVAGPLRRLLNWFRR